MNPPFDRVRRFPWDASALTLLGLAVAIIGLWSVTAWHELWPTPPGFERLQYDTAWGFAFCGIALAAHAARLSAVGRWCALVPILLGATRLLAFGARDWVEVHPLLANRWLPYGAGNYNDMGVLTALVFFTLGCALAAIGPRRYGALRSVLVAVLAAIALALAALLLFGVSIRSVLASQWLFLNGGERTSALLFLVLGGGVLAQVLLRSEDERQAVRRWLPGIVWFAAFACALVLWQALGLQQAGYVQNSTQLVAADIRNRIEGAFDARIRQLDRLAQRSMTYRLSEEEWQQDASTLLDESPGFQSISWASEEMVVRWVVPPAQANLVGQSLRADPAQARAIDAALGTHRSALTRLVAMSGAAGKGFVIDVPAFDGDKLRGIAAATLYGNWLSSLLGDRFADYYIALLDNGEFANTVGTSESAAGSEWTREQVGEHR